MKRTILVTGGRDYADRDAVFRSLDAVHAKDPIRRLIHGGCPRGGADKYAHDWAYERGVVVRSYPVDHDKDGPWPGAGPRRNARMVEDGEACGAVAFPGGAGTDGCVQLLLNADVPVWDLRGKA